MTYIRRPKSARWSERLGDDVLAPDTLVVYEGEPYVETGLLDSDGWPLARVRDPIGFRKED